MRSKRLWAASAVVAIAAAVTASTAGAKITGTTGQVTKLDPPPASVMFGALESNDTMHAFDEQQCVTLSQDVAVDINAPGTYDESADLTGGVIPAGTKVSSHFVHADKVGEQHPPIHLEGTVEFDADILGVILTQSSLNHSDWLGAPGTLYPTGDFGRHVELTPQQSDFVIVDAASGTIHSQIRLHADQIRIITKCKEPPPPPKCKIIGLGKLNKYQAFAFLVENWTPSGAAVYTDTKVKKTLKSTNITSVVNDADSATIVGTGKVGYSTVQFTIEVQDVPGPDTFSISWPGYSASGPIWWGGVEILCGKKCEDDPHPSVDR